MASHVDIPRATVDSMIAMILVSIRSPSFKIRLFPHSVTGKLAAVIQLTQLWLYHSVNGRSQEHCVSIRHATHHVLVLVPKRQRVGPAGPRTGELSVDGAAGFDKGRWPVRLLTNRAGFSPAPVSPIWAIARVPLSNPDAALELSRLIAAPNFFRLSRQPSGVGPGRSGAPARATAWAP
jgi:hypothetical protein